MSRFLKYFKPLNLYNNAKKSNGKLIGLDTGDNNCGVCLAQILPNVHAYPLYGNAIGSNDPYLVLKKDELTPSELAYVIRVLVDQFKACGLLIGYPNDERFRHNPANGWFVRETLLQLDSSGYLDDVPFTFVPEKNSSKIAKEYLEEKYSHIPEYILHKYNHSFAAAGFSMKFLLKASKNKIRKTKGDRETDDFLEMVALDMMGYTVNV